MLLDPGTLTHKALWLRAKDLIESNGELIPTWTDQSGVGNHGIATATASSGAFPKVVDNATPIGTKAVQFDGGGKFELGEVLTLGDFVDPKVSAKSYYSSEPPGNIIPGVTGNWTTGSGAANRYPTWWQMLMAVTKTLTTYSLTRRDDSATRNPKDFTFSGRNRAKVVSATASSSYNPTSSPPLIAFDDVPSTQWETVSGDNDGAWLAAQLIAPFAVTSYDVISGYYTNKTPVAWLFQGSDDGDIWVTLDNQTAQTFSASYVTNTYTFTNITPYLHYRLYSYGNGGGATTGLDMLLHSSWVVLDTRVGILWPTVGEVKTFTFDNTQAFNLYRLNITLNNGDTTYTSINEFNCGETVIGDVLLVDPGHEAWVVVKAESISTVPNGLWKWSNTSSTNSAYPSTNASSFYIYEQFCATSPANAYLDAAKAINNTWRVYRTTFQGSTLKFYLDGVEVASSTGQTADRALNAWLGESYYSSTRRAFKGKIAEVYVRNKVSSSLEAADLLKYFRTEHLIPSTTGMAPVRVQSRYPVGVVPELTGLAPVTIASSDFSILASTVTGTAPVDVKAESLFVADLAGYPGEAMEILIPIELSGIMDPIFPPPTPPVDFAGLVDPLIAPTLTKSDTAGGHLLVGTYRYSYAAWKGSPAQATAPSPWATITLTAEDTVTLTYPTIAGADGYLVYREDM